ncbi:MAG TPA: hypothetical protein H9948_11850 [Candidatus Jeotgalibaca merdavium]|uniref:Uncharacterized protein n=1 Tax=Candidatus Jeotgalibaca merdavium TaxID=2838627 RepID=A0A9D2KYN3_9LACT|nr:hypothetical protein [Candidatus Jeotgalibaca merdavium]
MKTLKSSALTILTIICLVLVGLLVESKMELDAAKDNHEQVIFELQSQLDETNDEFQKAKDHIYMMNIQRGEYMKTIERLQEELKHDSE